MSSPIADLSYRNYDGPLESPTNRWWVIARQLIRSKFRNKWYWIFSFLSGGYYFLLLIVTFFMEQMAANAPSPAELGAGGSSAPTQMFTQFMERLIWKDQFMHGLSFGQIWFLAIALLVGIGTIANDNRANALLVYLSKPCHKKDYLMGKWMGVFLLVLLGMALPVVFFFLYGALSYRQYGFLTDDPWMFPKVVAAMTFISAFHASFCVGISSMFNQGRLAGATYAGLYFISNFFTQFMVIIWVNLQQGEAERMKPFEAMVSKLYYASVDGVNIGMVKAVLGTDGSPWLGVENRMKMVPAPAFLPMMVIAGLIALVSMAIAWKRVRAVEVIG